MSTTTESEWLRAGPTPSTATEVDRSKGIIRDVILAEEGVFKSAGRGEFDRQSIEEVVRLAREKNPPGLKSRFAHPTESDDGIGKHLGRFKGARLHTITRLSPRREIAVAKADLYFDPTAMEEPVGGGRPLGDYIMALAENDPTALSCSLVIEPREEMRLDPQGRPLLGDDGNPLPPIWRPVRIHACDVVDTGEACHSFLSVETIDALPNAVVFRGKELLDRQFAGKPRAFVEKRLQAFLGRYLDTLGPAPSAPSAPAPRPGQYDPSLDADLRRRLIRQRARKAALTRQGPAPPPEGVRYLVHDGQSATMPQRRSIESDLAKVPHGLNRVWRQAGGRLDIMPAGYVVTQHPLFADVKGEKWRSTVAAADGVVVVMAADAVGESVSPTLHEVGHGLDACLTLARLNPVWHKLWADDIRTGHATAYGSQESDCTQHWAECFACYVFSGEARCKLSVGTRRYVRDLIARSFTN